MKRRNQVSEGGMLPPGKLRLLDGALLIALLIQED